jgi:hypothetical protein
VSAGVQAAVRCDTPDCPAYHRGPHWHPASDPGQAVTEARMSAQENGWRVKRGHTGTDRCPACREAP